MTTGEKIAYIVKERNTNLHRLADQAGVSYNTLYSIVRRKSDQIDIEIARKIAAALDLHPIEILGDNALMYVDYGMDLLERARLAVESSKRTIAAFESDRLTQIKYFYDMLTDEGQIIAVQRIEELSQIPKYQRVSKNDDT